jgi:hypothetical protein
VSFTGAAAGRNREAGFQDVGNGRFAAIQKGLSFRGLLSVLLPLPA